MASLLLSCTPMESTPTRSQNTRQGTALIATGDSMVVSVVPLSSAPFEVSLPLLGKAQSSFILALAARVSRSDPKTLVIAARTNDGALGVGTLDLQSQRLSTFRWLSVSPTWASNLAIDDLGQRICFVDHNGTTGNVYGPLTELDITTGLKRVLLPVCEDTAIFWRQDKILVTAISSSMDSFKPLKSLPTIPAEPSESWPGWPYVCQVNPDTNKVIALFAGVLLATEYDGDSMVSTGGYYSVTGNLIRSHSLIGQNEAARLAIAFRSPVLASWQNGTLLSVEKDVVSETETNSKGTYRLQLVDPNGSKRILLTIKGLWLPPVCCYAF